MGMNWGDVHNAVKGGFAKGAESTGSVIGKSFKFAKNAIGAGAGVVTGAVSGMASRPGAFIKGTAALGVLAAVAGTAAYVLRKPRKQDHPQPMVDMMPPVMPDMNTMQPNTMMGMAPVEGQQVARVQQGRQSGGPAVGM